MKQIIVMIASVILGIFLFNLIMGPQGNSLFSATKGVWNQEIQEKEYQP